MFCFHLLQNVCLLVISITFQQLSIYDNVQYKDSIDTYTCSFLLLGILYIKIVITPNNRNLAKQKKYKDNTMFSCSLFQPAASYLQKLL